MNRTKRHFLLCALAAGAFSLISAAHAESFGYFDTLDQTDSRSYHHSNSAPRYEDPYYEHQRIQRQSDNLRRQEENLSREYRSDIQQFQQSHRYQRRSRHY